MYGDFSNEQFGPLRPFGHEFKLPIEGQEANKTEFRDIGVLLPEENYTRVLFQQGRPITDADLNEQSARQLALTRALARSVFGWHGTSDCGFNYVFPAKIGDGNGTEKKTAPHICPGHYYVEGVRCENDQHGLLPPSTDKIQATTEADKNNYGVFLEAWDHSVSPLQDLAMREESLAGFDVSHRSRTRWALKFVYSKGLENNWQFPEVEPSRQNWQQIRKLIQHRFGRTTQHTRCLKVAIKLTSDQPHDCSPRLPSGAPGQFDSFLYRIEIHQPAPWKTSTTANAEGDNDKSRVASATFKWSRENGSALFAVTPINKTRLKVDSSGVTRDPLQEGDWVELLNEHGDPINPDKAIFQIASCREGEIVLDSEYQQKIFHGDALITSDGQFDKKLPQLKFVRRWFPGGAAKLYFEKGIRFKG